MKKDAFALALSLAALSGFAGSYKEPTGGPAATIEFVNEAADKMSLHLHGGASECTDRSSAGFVQARSQRKLTVPAGKDLVFTVGMDAGGAGQLALAIGGATGILLMPKYKGCTPTVDFVPDAGSSYVFKMNSDGRDCSFEFYALPPRQGEQASPVTFAPRQWIRAMGESGPWCKKKGG